MRKPLDVINGRVAWAHDVLGAWVASREDFSPLVPDLGNDSLGRGYELGNVGSVRYGVDAIPEDDQLLDDALSFAAALRELYRAHTKAPLPFEVPELVDLEEAAEDAAGNKRPARGRGFRQSKEESDLIANHAVEVAAAYYSAAGWKVKERGAPYDLELTRGPE